MTEPTQDKNSFAVVDITGLHKHFGDNEVLKGIDLKIKRQEVVCILGKSGSGKSTLLRCINGLETFHQGTLTEMDSRCATMMLRQCASCDRTWA